jgi:hypothetical protein
VATSVQVFGPDFIPVLPGAFSPDSLADVWPPPGPEPDLYQRGLTEARCVYEYHHGKTTEERLDGFQHLVNICMLKRGSSFWSPRPAVKYVDRRKGGYRTAHLDWENYGDGFEKTATRGWFQTRLPELIDRYSKQYITRRELLELIRLRDPDLLHVCNALIADLINESLKQQRQERVTIPPDSMTCVEKPTPTYETAVQMIVQDKRVRSVLPKKTLVALEALFRKLAAGVNPKNVIEDVAHDMNRDERTVRRYLERASEIRTKNSGVDNAMNLLAREIFWDSQAGAPAVEVEQDEPAEWIEAAYERTETIH